jgi:FkbM family methyltransferase
MIPGLINDRWQLVMPDFRVEFHRDRPKWEAGRLAAMFERVEPGAVVYDCGAEHGDFTALYRSWVGPEGTVIPIEPALAYWPCIRATWEANGFGLGPPLCFTGFVSDRVVMVTETCRLHDHGLTDGWPEAAFMDEPRADPGFRHLAAHTDHIRQVTIPYLASEEPDGRCYSPDEVVLDIEGAEWDALHGLEGWSSQPRCWVSVHPPTLAEWYGKTPDDIERLMRDLGYGPGEQLPANGEGEEFWVWSPE